MVRVVFVLSKRIDPHIRISVAIYCSPAGTDLLDRHVFGRIQRVFSVEYFPECHVCLEEHSNETKLFRLKYSKRKSNCLNSILLTIFIHPFRCK